MLKSLAIARAVPESLERRPPVATSVPVPSAALLATWIAPALKVTPPLNVLVPVIVNTASPFFTRRPEPLITPSKLVAVRPLTVSVLPCRFICPSPAMLAISSLLASLRLPSDPIETAMEFTSALPPLSVRVPRFTCVAPVKEFTPLRVNSLEPAFTKDPGPLTAPESVTKLSIFMFVVLLSNAPPAKFKSPLKSASPNATVPDKISPFATVRPVTESLVIRPVPIVTLPVPKPLL